MRLDERLRIARLVYSQAVARAQEEPTSASWSRLLAAAKNTRTASRDLERSLSRVPARAKGDPAPIPAPQDGSREAGGAAQSLPDPSALAWCELVAECVRARALIEQSRLLVQQARSLRSSVSEFALLRPRVIISRHEILHDLA